MFVHISEDDPFKRSNKDDYSSFRPDQNRRGKIIILTNVSLMGSSNVLKLDEPGILLPGLLLGGPV